MKLSSQFTVPAEPERVFSLFLDADVMRDSIPGCAELVRTDDETYRGRLENVVAHVRFNAGFSATIVSMDAPHQVVALLKGEDRRLGSTIKIDATLSVRPDPAGSLVGYEMEMALWGKIGRLGESIVRRRSVEIETQFVERFAAACAATRTATAPSVASAGSPARAESAAEARPTADATQPTARPLSGQAVGQRPAGGQAVNPVVGPKAPWWKRGLRSLRERIGRLRRSKSRGRPGSEAGDTNGTGERGSGSAR